MDYRSVATAAIGGWLLGTGFYQIYKLIKPKEYTPSEFRHRDALEDGIVAKGTTFEQFRVWEKAQYTIDDE